MTHFNPRFGSARIAASLATALLVTACSSTPTQQSAGQAIEDGVVTATVKAKLIEDPVTKEHQINVDTFKGNVSLSGFVESEQARVRALQLARGVNGVKNVKDAMQTRRGES